MEDCLRSGGETSRAVGYEVAGEIICAASREKKSFPYIFVKIFLMNETRASLINWIMFLLSAVGIILMLVYVREYFWMALPFVVTTFARALKIM